MRVVGGTDGRPVQDGPDRHGGGFRAHILDISADREFATFGRDLNERVAFDGGAVEAQLHRESRRPLHHADGDHALPRYGVEGERARLPPETRIAEVAVVVPALVGDGEGRFGEIDLGVEPHHSLSVVVRDAGRPGRTLLVHRDGRPVDGAVAVDDLDGDDGRRGGVEEREHGDGHESRQDEPELLHGALLLVAPTLRWGLVARGYLSLPRSCESAASSASLAVR